MTQTIEAVQENQGGLTTEERTQLLARLRQQVKEESENIVRIGRALGRKWAIEEATVTQLRRLDRHMIDRDLGRTFGDASGRTPGELFYTVVIDPQEYEPSGSWEDFWGDLDRPECTEWVAADINYVDAFADAAWDVFREVEDEVA